MKCSVFESFPKPLLIQFIDTIQINSYEEKILQSDGMETLCGDISTEEFSVSLGMIYMGGVG